MAYRYGQDRQQMALLPASLDEYVGPEHPVRAYDAFVDALDLDVLGIKLDPHKAGNSQYHPAVMLKLLLYGYSYGVTSSRKLEREVHNNLSFVWLMKNLKPDHKTIAEFRRKNLRALDTALKLCARLCVKLELIDGNILFVDSTKLRANAGKAHNHDKKWYRQELKKLDRKIEQVLGECERIDQAEADQGSLVAMPEQLAKARNLQTTIKTALQEFDRRGTRTKDGNPRRINRTDPECASMKSRQGTHPSYAVHHVVDDKHGLIVHSDSVNDANDSNQFKTQIIAAEENLQHRCETAVADAGYSNIEQVQKIDSNGRTVLVPSQAKAAKKAKAFGKQAFVYDPDQDCYFCPQGRRLIFRRFQNRQKTKRDYRIEKSALCRACEHFGQCTRSRQGRTITRHKYEALREEIDRRLEQPEMREIYGRRKGRVEHPFGYIKKAIGFVQFSLRGRLAVRAEASLVATCFNITRMIALLGGVKGFLGKLQTV